MKKLIIPLALLGTAIIAGGAPVLVTPTGVSAALTFTPPSPGIGFFPVGNLINNSGLSGSATISNYTTITHAAASSATAWTTDDPAPGGGDWFAEGNAPVALVFPLSGLHDLTALVFWGYHFGSGNGNEARAFTVEFSTDGGATYPASVNVARPLGSLVVAAAATLPFGAAYPANTVRVTVTDNQFGVGGGDRIGIGEVKFIGEAAVNPAPVIQLPPGIVDFGDYGSDPGSVARTIAVTNAGPSHPLHLGSVTLSGPDAGKFAVASAPGVIAAGATQSIGLTFQSGAATGCFTAQLHIASNDPARPSVSVGLLASVGCPPGVPVPPVFSHPPGTFGDNFSLSMTTATPGAVILYTTNGTVPGPTNGQILSGALAITKSTMVRAATLYRGQLSSMEGTGYIKLSAALRSKTSPLPMLVLENFGAGPVPDKGWTTSTQTGAGLRQKARQPVLFSLHDRSAVTGRSALLGASSIAARAGIRVRGAFSSTWFPQPYSVETWDEQNADKSIAPLGMPKESDWVLYHPHPSYDATMIFNTYIWELSRKTGRYAPAFRYVEVYVNEDGSDLEPSDRRGLYALVEEVKRDADRLDFDALSADGSSGGWLHSINRMDAEPENGFPAANGASSPQFFRTAGPNRILQTTGNNPAQVGDDIPRQYNAFINFEEPGGYEVTASQRSAIEGWFTQFEDALYNNATWRDPVNGYRKYLNTRDFIDYFQLLNLARQGDGLLLSMYPWVSSGDRRLHMGPMWDFNNGAYHLSGAPASTLYFRQDQLWYPRLFADPDFLNEYVDRWFELRRGPYSNASLHAIADGQAAAITTEIANAQGLSTIVWNSRLTAMKTFLVQRADWIDSQYVKPPDFSPPPGVHAGPFTLTLTNPAAEAGTIYFTTDGSDPRGASGAPRGTAYTVPVNVVASARYKARTYTVSGKWSGLNEGLFIAGVPASASSLVISEIHYNPPGAADAGEFLEVMNIAATPLQLTGAGFDSGIQFSFPDGAVLAAGERAIVAATRTDFPLTGGPRVLGEFAGGSRLDNGGEHLRLKAWDGAVIREFVWDDVAPWPVTPDGNGPSMTLIAPESNPDPSQASAWRPSMVSGGTPGFTDAVPFTGDPHADDDGDGISNVCAYALGLNLPGTELPAVTQTGDRLTWRVGLNPAAEDATIHCEWSADLQAWQPASTLFPQETRLEGPGLGGREFDTGASVTASRVYLRVRVTLP